MPSLSDIVQVSVVTQTAQVKQAGFGIPLILGGHSRFPERIRYYTAVSEMLTDGFLTSDPEYKAASDLLAQNPQVTKVGIGRRATPATLDIRLTPIALNSTVYAVKVTAPNGTQGTASFTSDASATIAEITAGLSAAVTALSLTGVSAFDNSGNVRITATTPGEFVAVEVLDLSRLTVAQVQGAGDVAASLAAIQLENDEWYAVTMTTNSPAEILAAAAWVETAKKLLIVASQDGDVYASAPSPDDIAKDLKDANYFRTALIFHPDGNHFAGAAWIGATMANDPGAITFAFRQLVGISKTALTASQVTNLKAKNANYFSDYGGIGITQEGKVAAGEWIDIIRDRDWYESRLKTLVYSVLANNLKVPFTDNGIGLIEAQVRKATREAINAGFLAEGTDTYIVPKAADVSSVDRAARRLATIKVSARVAGAIHVVKIDATITA